MISARLVRARLGAAALPTLAIVAILILFTALLAQIAERQSQREEHAARFERWDREPLRAERDLREPAARGVARLEATVDRP